MATEITVLALGALLLVVHILVAVLLKTRQYGTEWNMGARDEDTPELNAIPARLERARDNFLETFPVAIVALFGVVLADKANDTTAILAWVWFAARAIYLPLYWAGIPYLRTVVWLASMLSLLGVLSVLILD